MTDERIETMSESKDDRDLEIPREGFRFPEPPEGLERRLFRETSRVVRFHPWRRRIGIIGSLAAAYLAGLVTMGLLGETESPSVVVSPVAGEAPATPEGEWPSWNDPLPADPAELEGQLARAAKPVRSRLLREAGDRYLATEADVVRALYCYRRVLDAEPLSPESPMDPPESWLLTVLKHAREQEVKRVGRADG